MKCIYNKDFQLVLVFKNIEGFTEVPITQPSGFETFSQKIVQKKKGYARDIQSIEDSITLTFFKGAFEKVDFKTTLPNGIEVEHLTMGYEFLIEAYKQKGFETKCELHIINKDIIYIVGDVKIIGTDEQNFVKAKILQSGKKQLLKRRSSIKVEVLGDNDLDDNYIGKAKTEKILIKSKPTEQKSEWNVAPYVGYTYNQNNQTFHNMYQNPFNIIKVNGIDGTISPYDKAIGTWNGDENQINKIYDFGIIDAIEDLVDVKVTIPSLFISYYIPTNKEFTEDWNNSKQAFSVQFLTLPKGEDKVDASDIINSHSELFAHPNSGAPDKKYSLEYKGIESVNQFNTVFKGDAKRYDVKLKDVTFTIPSVPRGTRLCWIWDMGRDYAITNWRDGRTIIKVTAKGIDRVLNGVLYKDFLENVAKKTSGHDLKAPQFDKGGEHHLQFVMNGDMLRGRESKFPVSFKDAYENLVEVNCDYQANENEIIIGHESNFYPNIDLGAFMIAPDDSYEVSPNDKLAINELSFSYNNYEQDKDERNTQEAIHTESQWHVPNEQVENKKKIQIKLVRDPFKIEAVSVQGTRNNTSTSNDNTLFAIDAIEIPEGTDGGFQANLYHNINSDLDLELINDDTFDWRSVGVSVDTFLTISSEKNSGIFVVKKLTKTRITLQGNSSFKGFDLTKVVFDYTGVKYAMKTDEDYLVVFGISAPDRFANLFYSIKRNIGRWLPYLSSACLHTDKPIKNTFFKNDTILTTVRPGDELNYKETAPINKDKLNKQIINTNIIRTKIASNFAAIVELLKKQETTNANGDIGGFIRIIDPNKDVRRVYVQDLDFEIATGNLPIKSEEKYDPEILKVETEQGLLKINGAAYKRVGEWFDFDGEKFQFFDDKGFPIFKPLVYNFIELNGNAYNSKLELKEKLTLIN